MLGHIGRTAYENAHVVEVEVDSNVPGAIYRNIPSSDRLRPGSRDSWWRVRTYDVAIMAAMHTATAEHIHVSAVAQLMRIRIRVVLPIHNDAPLPAVATPPAGYPTYGEVVVCNGEMAGYVHYTCFTPPDRL